MEFSDCLVGHEDTFKANVGQPELKCRALFLMKIHVPNFLEICCFKGSKSSFLIASFQSRTEEVTCLPPLIKTVYPFKILLRTKHCTRIRFLAKYKVIVKILFLVEETKNFK